MIWLGGPSGWIASLGGAFAGIWAGLFLFRRFESVFRATSVAFMSASFLATLYAVTVIQGQITQI